ncbi:MAG: RNA polymerase sigma factor [bacterium]
MNPFTERYAGDREDREMVGAALAGDRLALEQLIRRHQGWIYNIAIRMVMHPQDAEDVTQEILIKLITRLATYQGRSSFRTWLYRLVANHVIDMGRRRGEQVRRSFAEYGRGIDATPDAELPDQRQFPVDVALVVEETKLGCMMAMLLCLERRQRLAFILGAAFGVGDHLGGAIMEITRENFRQQLSRARRKVANFMNEKCGLIHAGNSCHCDRKTQPLIDAGIVDPNCLQFSINGAQRLKAVARQRERKFDDFVEAQCGRLFRDTPFYDSPDLVASLQQVLAAPDFDGLFELTN